MRINRFSGYYSFLSNFHVLENPILVDNIPFVSVEHAYQACKSTNPDERWLISKAYCPAEAKRRGQSVVLRPNWGKIKIAIMERLLRLKFSDSVLALKLINTRPSILTEGNTWHDNFWGVCYCSNCAGTDSENWLGFLLERIREDLL